MDKQHGKRVRRTWRRTKSENTHRFTQDNTKMIIKLENTRPWSHTWILVQEIHLHPWQTTTRNEQMPTRSRCTWIDDQSKDHINLKDPLKGTAPNNYRPIMYLPMMWKILTAQIWGRDLWLFNKLQIVPDEQMGCHKGSRGVGELLYIDQHILNEGKKRQKNLVIWEQKI